MRLILILPLTALAACFCTSPANAQKKAEPLVERVRVSIDKAVQYLRDRQEKTGGWESIESGREIIVKTWSFKGGGTSLALLALLNAGVPLTDKAVSDGLKYLKEMDLNTVYSKSLQTMVFAEVYHLEGDKARKAIWQQAMRSNVKWLLDVRRGRDADFLGWSYADKPIISDNSNTQFALLALWMASHSGVEIAAAEWRSIQNYYIKMQQDQGSWAYFPNKGGDPSLTMTTAGLSGLLIASMELNLVCKTAARPGMESRLCGVYADAEPVAKATQWIADRFTIQFAPKTFYHLYGLERAGRLTGERFIGDHDWYREGCEYLTSPGVQKANGAFFLGGVYDQWPLVSTSFGLLFLSKGRTPVLISKMVHFSRERGDDRDWNNDRNDLRHLVPFCGEQLFKGVPLAWQSFDIQRPLDAIQRRRPINDDDIADIAAELMQSPILYITGHRDPNQRFTALERKVIAKYVDSGGFIFAEACCDSGEFDKGFKDLVKDDALWPDNDLSPLDGKHPVWSSNFLVKPDDKTYPLYGISRGCKTILIYSPNDMSCFWEKNLQEDRTGRGHLAFRLGANIVAYATGKEPPKPRLTPVDVVRVKDEPGRVPRGHLEVAQIYHRGDWNPAKHAMRNLMDHVNRHAGVDVVRTTKKIQIHTEDLSKHKFLYMQGRAAFDFPEEDLKALRFNLTHGGLLFADASCGKIEFDQAFRAFAKQLFPGKELERVPVKDFLFSSKLTGIDLDETTIRGRIKSGEDPRSMAPFLEGIRVDGRWAVLYSKYDIGCALERHSTSDCLGYTPESAYRIATAAVLYTYWPFPKEK